MSTIRPSCSLISENSANCVPHRPKVYCVFLCSVCCVVSRVQTDVLEKERDLMRVEKERTARLIKQYKMEKGHVLEVRTALLFSLTSLRLLFICLLSAVCLRAVLRLMTSLIARCYDNFNLISLALPLRTLCLLSAYLPLRDAQTACPISSFNDDVI
jgi:hypothetical protein